jgi:hypothetical protein
LRLQKLRFQWPKRWQFLQRLPRDPIPLQFVFIHVIHLIRVISVFAEGEGRT